MNIQLFLAVKVFFLRNFGFENNNKNRPDENVQTNVFTPKVTHDFSFVILVTIIIQIETV